MSTPENPRSKPPMRGVRWQRGWLTVMVVVILIEAIALGVFAQRIWNPQTDSPSKADAIVVLAYGQSRLDEGRELAELGVSDNLVISRSNKMDKMIESGKLKEVSPEQLAKEGVPDEPWVEQCGVQYPHYFTTCFEPEPNTTLGEALVTEVLAKSEGWESIALVTERSHLGRAETIFERCTSLDIEAASSGNPGPFYRDIFRTAYEVGALFKDGVQGSCL